MLQVSLLFYDVIVYLYAFSLLLFFADFLHHNVKANRLAFRLLILVWTSQTTFFLLQFMSKGYFPVITRFETLFFYAWLLVTLSLIINYYFRVSLFLFFTNIIGFIVMVLSLFTNPTLDPLLSDNLKSHLMFIHITMAFLSYAAFLVAGIFSGMYLLQNSLLKQKKWTPLLRRLPSIKQLGEYSYLLISLGVPLLAISLILGLVWASLVIPDSVWFDPKVLFSLIVLVAYGIYLYGKVMRGWYGEKLAWWSLIAFATVFANYMIVQNLSLFHSWF